MQSVFDEDFLKKLKQRGVDHSREYQTNDPFPNIYLDNFLPVDAAEAALQCFPEPTQIRWNEFADRNQTKLAFNQVEKLPGAVRDILYFLNSRPMLEFLEALTGITGVIPDPYYLGAGLHQIKRGGRLEIHADFNRHSAFRLDRRLNVLLYMNKDWQEEYGGHFELWNKSMTAPVVKIAPLFNRCAIFSTTSTSFHGLPHHWLFHLSARGSRLLPTTTQMAVLKRKSERSIAPSFSNVMDL
jgi:Rps23 Pro-64 3,4-dihydroxylase Tpa1-like proline 4-hydroxylase